MKEQFVTLAIAKELKLLGFNEPCMIHVYTGNTAVNVDTYHECLPRLADDFNKIDMCISIPLWQQVLQWFREKHNFHIEIHNGCSKKEMDMYFNKYKAKVVNTKFYNDDIRNTIFNTYYFDTYEDVLENTILHVIETIKYLKPCNT